MTREEAIYLVDKFDGNYDPIILERFCRYLDISIEEFWAAVDKYVNYNLFEKLSMGIYRKKYEIGMGV